MNVSELLEEQIHDNIILGAAVLAGTREKELFRLECGCADAARNYPMTCSTVIDIASVTKVAATATAMLILHARGLIDFDAPFTEYLPEYTAHLDRVIRIRDLANHVSGFDSSWWKVGDSAEELLDHVFHRSPPAAPVIQYSCWNYVLLCKVVENIAKQSLPDFCMQNIFKPLNMNSTSIGKPLPVIPVSRLAQTPATPEPGIISDYPAKTLYAAGYTTGNAGCFSTAEDLAELLKCYLAHGAGLFTEKEFDLIRPLSGYTVHDSRNFAWSMMDNNLYEGGRGKTLLHSGWSGQTVFLNYEKNMYVIVLTPRCGDYVRAKQARFRIYEELCSILPPC